MALSKLRFKLFFFYMASDEMDAAGAMNIADTLMRNDRWRAAVVFLEGHSEIVNGDFSLSWTTGWAYCKLKQFGEARRFLLQATRLARDAREEVVAYWALGHSYCGLGQYEQAEASLRESLRIGDYLPARLELAFVLMKRGCLVEAEQVHLDGIQLKPESSDRWEAFAEFLSDVGREAESQTAMEKARSVSRNPTPRMGPR